VQRQLLHFPRHQLHPWEPGAGSELKTLGKRAAARIQNSEKLNQNPCSECLDDRNAYEKERM
jgi:hypothetical protein